MRLSPVIALIAFCVSAHADPLCKPKERVVFSCVAWPKIVSLCASNDLKSPAGRLYYRFGESKYSVELEYSNGTSPLSKRFSFDYDNWSKGEILTVSFKRGAYQYSVYHAHGAFGVDGGPNRAGVKVVRDGKEIADVDCHEESAVDNIDKELDGIDLPGVRRPHS